MISLKHIRFHSRIRCKWWNKNKFHLYIYYACIWLLRISSIQKHMHTKHRIQFMELATPIEKKIGARMKISVIGYSADANAFQAIFHQNWNLLYAVAFHRMRKYTQNNGRRISHDERYRNINIHRHTHPIDSIIQMFCNPWYWLIASLSSLMAWIVCMCSCFHAGKKIKIKCDMQLWKWPNAFI